MDLLGECYMERKPGSLRRCRISIRSTDVGTDSIDRKVIDMRRHTKRLRKGRPVQTKHNDAIHMKLCYLDKLFPERTASLIVNDVSRALSMVEETLRLYLYFTQQNLSDMAMSANAKIFLDNDKEI